VAKLWLVLAEQHLGQTLLFSIRELGQALRSLLSERVIYFTVKYSLDVNLVGICPEA
jgi:hypothetical protein